MIGIIGAMDAEIELISKKIDNCVIKTIGNRSFYCGVLNGANVVAVVSGIGKVNAAVTTSLLFDNFDIDYVINTGIAGGANDVKPFDLVFGKELFYHDVDLTFIGYKYGVMPGCDKSFKTDDKLREICVNYAKKNGISYVVGNIASGDLFASDKSCLDKLDENINAVEMEGAAIAQVCTIFEKPFISIRMISDILGSNEQSATYAEYEREASGKASLIVCEIIGKIAIDKKDNNIV